MKHGGHAKRVIWKNKIKSLGLALLAVILVVGVAGTTIAYLSHSSNAVTNTFSLSEITCEIQETVSGDVKSSVKVANTGKTAAYIRVAVIANTVDASGNVTAPADVTGSLGGTNWVKSGMYYYYTQPVSPSGTTGELLSSSIDLTEKQVTILAEAIQSKPADAAQNAWGVDPASPGSN